jgi:cell division protein FtsZ
MKGARGLLISITGGKDLTLYEVDEAATRIREEVDQDANIIVGATFDETLEGIIRVSVVATGIEQAAMAAQRPVAVAEAKIAEVTQKLRADNVRTDRLERMESPRANPVANPAVPSITSEAIEQAAKAAVAAAVLPMTEIEDVTIRPIQPKPSLFPEANAPVAVDPPAPRTFIPPAPERPAGRPRMPRIDELPVPGQRELRAKRGEVEPEAQEKPRGGLLRRLAAVGLGRRESDQPDAPANVRPVRPMPRPAERSAAPPPPARPAASRPPEPRGPEPVSEYAKRPPHQGLDQHGRQAPVHNTGEEDQLDIPAFLRRQAN